MNRSERQVSLKCKLCGRGRARKTNACTHTIVQAVQYECCYPTGHFTLYIMNVFQVCGSRILKVSSKVKFTERKLALQHTAKCERNSCISPRLDEQMAFNSKPLLRETFKEPPLVSYKKGKYLRDIHVRAKL